LEGLITNTRAIWGVSDTAHALVDGEVGLDFLLWLLARDRFFAPTKSDAGAGPTTGKARFLWDLGNKDHGDCCPDNNHFASCLPWEALDIYGGYAGFSKEMSRMRH